MDSDRSQVKNFVPVAEELPGLSPSVPWQIWITIFLLSLEGLGNLLAIPGEPAAAKWLAAKALFITGLILGWRLVFVWFLAVGLLHVQAFRPLIPFAAFLNLVLVILVASAWRHFFPRRDRGPLADGTKMMIPRTGDPDFDL